MTKIVVGSQKATDSLGAAFRDVVAAHQKEGKTGKKYKRCLLKVSVASQSTDEPDLSEVASRMMEIVRHNVSVDGKAWDPMLREDGRD